MPLNFLNFWPKLAKELQLGAFPVAVFSNSEFYACQERGSIGKYRLVQ